jgi:amino acid transporter
MIQHLITTSPEIPFAAMRCLDRYLATGLARLRRFSTLRHPTEMSSEACHPQARQRSFFWYCPSSFSFTPVISLAAACGDRVAKRSTQYLGPTRNQCASNKTQDMPIDAGRTRPYSQNDSDHDDAPLLNESASQVQYDTFAPLESSSRNTSHHQKNTPTSAVQGHNPVNMNKTDLDYGVNTTVSYGADLEAEASRGGRNDHEGDFVTHLENNTLARGLRQRHITMIGIAGAIGTGLFLGLGGSIQTGGPLGALLGYATVGLIVCAVQFALGEVAALLPVTGSFVRHAEFLVDPAFGFAIGLNIVYGNLLSVPAEISAICVLFQFWTDLNPAIWICIFIAITFAVGISFIGIYGEVEFFFAALKILLVIFLIILGLVIDLGGIPGQERIGFRYWKQPGPFVEYIASGPWGQFLGYWAVMTNAVFSFAGVESLAMAAAETQNPRRNIPKACKNVFARVLLFYVLAGMLFAASLESLLINCSPHCRYDSSLR